MSCLAPLCIYLCPLRCLTLFLSAPATVLLVYNTSVCCAHPLQQHFVLCLRLCTSCDLLESLVCQVLQQDAELKALKTKMAAIEEIIKQTAEASQGGKRAVEQVSGLLDPSAGKFFLSWRNTPNYDSLRNVS